MSEMALVSSRKFKLENARKKGVRGARTALALSENPTSFLSTVQIGITLIGVLLGIYSGENLTGGLEVFLAQFDLLRPFAHNIAVGGVVVFVTYLSIVLGELVPKRLGLNFPEPIAMTLARPMKLLSKLTAPFVWLLTISNNLILRLMGIKNNLDSKITEEEIKSIIRESAKGGEIQHIEQDIVERVFELGDRKVNALMTHRNGIIYFNETDGIEVIRRKISTEKHSAYPVCKEDDLDNISGLVLLKDLIEPMLSPPFSLANHLRKPLFTSESTFAYKMLELFKKEKSHYAIVVDEFGATRGMITMDDVLDALVGDVSESPETDYQIIQRDANQWYVDGQFPVSDFLKHFDIQTDKNTEREYLTVAGLIIAQFKSLPNEGDKIRLHQYELEVVDKDMQRIDKILITKME